MARSRFSPQEINASKERVLATLDASGLHRDSTLILGGGALALNGIRPAHDVDVMVISPIFSRIREDGRMPSGMVVVPKHGTVRPWLTTPTAIYSEGAKLYNTDITLPVEASPNSHLLEPVDERFLDEIQRFPAADGWKYLSIESIIARLSAERGFRLKSSKDINLIRKWQQTTGNDIPA